jgi:hypothetical protein
MEAEWRVFWEPKLGSQPAEYEDAYWPAAGRRTDERFAVADGATENSYSRDWASLLVERYGTGATWRTSFLRALPELQTRWSTAREGLERSWYAEQKIQQGAFAAFLGVRLIPRGTHFRLHGLAVGDCELLHIAKDQLHCAFPLTRSSDFGSHPALIGTATPTSMVARLLRGRREDIAAGDSLLLLSDAIAAWVLKRVEANSPPWTQLLGLETGDAVGFQAWVDEVRRRGEMRNDDVTLGIVSVG